VFSVSGGELTLTNGRYLTAGALQKPYLGYIDLCCSLFSIFCTHRVRMHNYTLNLTR